MKTDIVKAEHPVALLHAADTLKNGGLIAFPTDTVYGLASLPFNAEHIDRLYVAKGRNSQKAISILLGEREQVSLVAREMSSQAIILAEVFWPGPLTLILPRQPSLPRALTPDDTVGVRIPNHPVALALLKLVGPLAVTSANLSGQESTVSAQEVLEQLDGRIHLVIDGGKTPGGVPSTVVEAISDELEILREGPITQEDIEAAIRRETPSKTFGSS